MAINWLEASGGQSWVYYGLGIAKCLGKRKVESCLIKATIMAVTFLLLWCDTRRDFRTSSFAG